STVKRPLVVYTLVFGVALAFAIITLASVALIRVANEAVLEVAQIETRALAAQHSADDVRAQIDLRAKDPLPSAVITSSASKFGIDLNSARSATRRLRDQGVIAFRINDPNTEAYLVRSIDPSLALSIAGPRIQMLIVTATIAAVVGALLL